MRPTPTWVLGIVHPHWLGDRYHCTRVSSVAFTYRCGRNHGPREVDHDVLPHETLARHRIDRHDVLASSEQIATAARLVCPQHRGLSARQLDRGQRDLRLERVGHERGLHLDHDHVASGDADVGGANAMLALRERWRSR